jgi:hypothetical protein
MSEEIDVTNDQFVGANGMGDVTVAFPKARMTRAEALRHAAWLVAVAEEADGDFEQVLKAVRSS